MYKLPELSNNAACGSRSSALKGGPPSPEKVVEPFPAIVLILPGAGSGIWARLVSAPSKQPRSSNTMTELRTVPSFEFAFLLCCSHRAITVASFASGRPCSLARVSLNRETAACMERGAELYRQWTISGCRQGRTDRQVRRVWSPRCLIRYIADRCRERGLQEDRNSEASSTTMSCNQDDPFGLCLFTHCESDLKDRHLPRKLVL
jgi:hypothetical protein